MTTSNQKQAPITDARTFRLHGMGVMIVAPVTLVAVIAFWLLLGAQSLKDADSQIIAIARFIVAPFAFFTLIGAPIYFIAGAIQLITGKRISMVEALYEKKSGKQEITTSKREETNANK